MLENKNWDKSKNLESEIAELSKQIEIKRGQLETEKGIVSDKDVIAEVITSDFKSDSLPEEIPVSIEIPETTSTGSYLDSLDETSALVINGLIQSIPDKGIKNTIKKAASHPPFILDAFHDALVDKLYDELKSRGIVS